MNLNNYINLVRKHPKPSPEQINNFIKLVSMDHSWYKHLTQERIHDFVIYLDPNAGRSLIGYREEANADICIKKHEEFKSDLNRLILTLIKNVYS